MSCKFQGSEVVGMDVIVNARTNVMHRSGCKYIKMSESRNLINNALEEASKGNRKCKCCCNLNFIYKQCESTNEKFEKVHNFKIEKQEEQIAVSIGIFTWAIKLDSILQKLRVYEFVDSENQMVLDIEFKPQEKLKDCYKYLNQEAYIRSMDNRHRINKLDVNRYAKENNLNITMIGDLFYVSTDMALWKIEYSEKYGDYRLFHCPTLNKDSDIESIKSAKYHRQSDIPYADTVHKYLTYIVSHDKAKQIEKVDYRKLPHSTKKQKKYYQQAKNRAEREKRNRLDELFASISIGNKRVKQYVVV